MRRWLLRGGCALIAFLAAAYVIAWVTVFRHPPASMADAFYWTTAGHLVMALLVNSNAAFGSWLCCVLGILLGAGVLT